MTRQESQTREDIIDKAKGFLIKQYKIVLRTIPSTKFPKGAKYEGYIMDVTDKTILLHDTYVDKQIHIYISEIASPADLWEKEGENE